MKIIPICFIVPILLLTACTKGSNNIKNENDILGLNWYSEKDIVKHKMQDYDLKSESEEVGAAGEKQTLLEYSGVTLYDRPCYLTLCFTSLGLIGVNYHDANGQYQEWIEQITSVYGEPTETSEYGVEEWNDVNECRTATWENDPLGTGTSIYVFYYRGNGVQISFFTDETGSEMSPQ